MTYDVMNIKVSQILRDFLFLFAHILQDKAVNISLLFNLFAQGFAATMAGFAINTNQNRCCATLCLLQSCSKLKAVCGHNTVVMVGRCNECCGIVHTFFNIMQRRIAPQIIKHFL